MAVVAGLVAHAPGNQGRRFFGLALADAGFVAPSIILRLSLVALVAAALAWRLTCAVAWLRIAPASRLAPLSHMLMKGFFFSQGLVAMDIHVNSAMRMMKRAEMRMAVLWQKVNYR